MAGPGMRGGHSSVHSSNGGGGSGNSDATPTETDSLLGDARRTQSVGEFNTGLHHVNNARHRSGGSGSGSGSGSGDSGGGGGGIRYDYEVNRMYRGTDYGTAHEPLLRTGADMNASMSGADPITYERHSHASLFGDSRHGKKGLLDGIVIGSGAHGGSSGERVNGAGGSINNGGGSGGIGGGGNGGVVGADEGTPSHIDRRLLGGAADKGGEFVWNNKWRLFFSFNVTLVVVLCGSLYWPHMSLDAWVAIVDTMLVLFALVFSVAETHTILLASMVPLLVLDVLDVNDALIGFSNAGVLSIAVLFVVAEGVRASGALDRVLRVLLPERAMTTFEAQLRLILPVAVMSSFINNTPVVAVMIPVVESWANTVRVSASKLFIPLSFGAIMGGTCTLIGTSTNLIVLGLVQERDPSYQLPFFEIALLGVPLMLTGSAFIVLTSKWLLPNRETLQKKFAKNPREYTVPMQVHGPALVGKSVFEAGLSSLPNLYLAAIERDNMVLQTVSPETLLAEHDVLYFAGIVDSVMSLRAIDGLVVATDEVHKLSVDRLQRSMCEVVVAPGSYLVNRTLSEVRFRSRYNAVVFAIFRQGARINQKLGTVTLYGGDTLLLEAGAEFIEQHRYNRNFSLVAEVSTKVRELGNRRNGGSSAWMSAYVCVLVLGMITAVSFNAIDLFPAALTAAGLMLLSGVISQDQAIKSVNGRLILTIASAFALGQALDSTGASETVANSVVDVLAHYGDIGVLLGVYAVTTSLAAVINSGAAAAIMFPVAYQLIDSTALETKTVVYTLMASASASFMTPIGYQTNLMVWGPGAYKFTDFSKLGVPLQLLHCATTVVLSYYLFNVLKW